jgi:hypothetical protein
MALLGSGTDFRTHGDLCTNRRRRACSGPAKVCLCSAIRGWSTQQLALSPLQARPHAWLITKANLFCTRSKLSQLDFFFFGKTKVHLISFLKKKISQFDFET